MMCALQPCSLLPPKPVFEVSMAVTAIVCGGVVCCSLHSYEYVVTHSAMLKHNSDIIYLEQDYLLSLLKKMDF